MKKYYLIATFFLFQLAQSQSFIKHTIDDTFGFSRGVQVVDLDNDNNLDIVSLTTDDTPEIACWFGDGLGNFTSKISIENDLIDIGSQGDDIEVLDVNNDGFLDIIASVQVIGANDIIAWWPNNQNRTFDSRVIISTAGKLSNDILIFDADNNNFEDIIMFSSDSQRINNKIELFPNNGDGTFGIRKVIQSFSSDIRGLHGDLLNGDSIFDIIVTDDIYIDVSLGNGDGTFATPFRIEDDYTYTNFITTGKVNNDDHLDIIVSGINGAVDHINLKWYQGDGAGNFSAGNIISQNEYSQITHPYLADLDNDGDKDIVAPTFVEFGDLVWWINDGNGNFGSAQVIAEDFWPGYDLKIADINKDNKLDIVATNGDGVFWFENAMTLSTQTYHLEENIFLYPNPSKGNVSLISNDITIQSIKIYDSKGALIDENTDGNVKQFDLSAKAKGIYFVKIITETGQIVKKVLKK